MVAYLPSLTPPMPKMAWRNGLGFCREIHAMVLEINGVTPVIVNMISWVSREKPNPFKHAVFGIGGMSDGKYATIFALSHLRDTLSKIGALVVPTLLGLGPYPDVMDENDEPNEGNIKWKVGQMVRELTHFSRGGI